MMCCFQSLNRPFGVIKISDRAPSSQIKRTISLDLHVLSEEFKSGCLVAVSGGSCARQDL